MSFTIKPIHSRPRRGRVRKLLGPLLVVAIFVFLAGAISLAMLTAWVSRDLPNPDTLLDRSVALSTKIYDRTGTHLLYDIHGEQARTLVKLDELPEYVKWSTIAIEDKDFYQHHGYVLRSILRAILTNLFHGSRVRGASTLTQQFVKNAILTPEKTFARKIREFVLATEIEQRFTKDQILQLYFNEIPYGRANYGIEAASQGYFGVSAKNLSVAQAATLAALTQAPTSYLNDLGRLKTRRNLVLDLMVEQNHLSKDDATRAKKDPLTLRQRKESVEAPHFVLWVKQMLSEKYGERLVEQGGLKIITTLDYDKQKAAEAAVAAGMKKVEEKGGANAALVAIDPKTGHILAMVGSRDYFADALPAGCTPGFNCQFDPQVNIALQPRQPGSSFKPIVYAASFLKGYTPTTILYDVDTIFKTDIKDYEPHNYTGKEYGPVTVRQALAGSLNIPAVKMIYLTGIDRVLDLADALGYTTLKDRSRFGLSLVLGGGEVKLLEHASTFATFANEGVHHDPVAILHVEDAHGAVLEDWQPSDGRIVIDPEVTREITDIISDNNARTYIFGAQSHLVLPDRPVAAKTGTTNDFHDAWSMGYVPSLAAGVWVGNNDNKAMGRGADGSVVAGPIWQQFMMTALAKTPPEKFTPPQPIATGKPILDGQLPGDVPVQIDRASGLLAGPRTPPNWIEERVFHAAHDTLFYINKDDPRGPPPVDPASDPQFLNWESAVARWAAAHGGANTNAAPTTFDNLHVPENEPQISIDSAAVSGHTMTVSLRTSAPRGVARVTYVVDGVLAAERRGLPLDSTIELPPTLPSGDHTLTVTAYDDIDNSKSVNQSIQIE